MTTKNISVCCFSATQGLNMCRLLTVWTTEKLVTPSVTKHVYINPCISLIKHDIYVLSLVYLPILWLFETLFFLIKIGGWKDFMFQNENVRALDTLPVYSNTVFIFSNKHSLCLVNFETVRCSSCKRTVLIRGRRLFRSYWNGKY